MYVSIIKGDFTFKEWDDGSWSDFGKKVHYLRMNGYRKINQDQDHNNYYESYRKKGKKEIITLTMMCV